MTISPLPFSFRPTYIDRTGLIAEWAFWTGQSNDLYGTNDRTDFNVTYNTKGAVHAFSKTSYTLSPEMSLGTGDLSIELWAIIASSPIVINTYHDTTDAYYASGGDQVVVYSTGFGGAWKVFGGVVLGAATPYYFYQVSFPNPTGYTNWHHVVYTIDRDNSALVNIYVDGVAGTYDSGGGGPTTAAEIVTMGCTGSNLSNDWWLNGTVGELRYWGKYLTANQALALHDATQWRYA